MGRVVVLLFLVLCCITSILSPAAEGLPSASYDYRDALEKAIIFFEGQRSGKLPSNQRAKWRGDSGLSDGKLENVDLIGGYYDAGDNIKFTWPMSFTVGLLSWAAVEYRTHQQPELLDAIRWGIDFILKCHVSSTTFYTQIGDGADHSCWERPEDMDTPRTLFKITPDSPGTEVAADGAAAFAAASIAFRKVDSEYSALLLTRAESLLQLADKYRSSYSGSCPFYCSYSSYQDELLWAATWLYKATGKDSYLDYVSSNKAWSGPVIEFSWDNKFAGTQAILAKEFFKGKTDLEKYKNESDSFVCALMPGNSYTQIQTTPGGLLYTRDASNLQYTSSGTMVLLFYSNILETANVEGVQCGSVKYSTAQITAFAKSQIDYILGNNPLKISYMAGFGSKFPTQLHHRGASIPSIFSHPDKVTCNDGFSIWYPSTAPNPNVHVGAIVGGPGSNDEFHDLRNEYSHSEPTTYMNAAFVGSLTALIVQMNAEGLQMPTHNYETTHRD